MSVSIRDLGAISTQKCDSMLPINECCELRLLTTGGRTYMLSRYSIFTKSGKIIYSMHFVPQPLKSIE